MCIYNPEIDVCFYYYFTIASSFITFHPYLFIYLRKGLYLNWSLAIGQTDDLCPLPPPVQCFPAFTSTPGCENHNLSPNAHTAGTVLNEPSPQPFSSSNLQLYHVS